MKWIYHTLQYLGLLWLGLRQVLRTWLLLSLRQLLLWRYTRIVIKLGVFCFCGLLLFFTPTLETKAQEATLTPTENWVPLYPTSTPAPLTNYDCGDIPEEYGQVTPDLTWWMNCSECNQVWNSTLTPSVPISGTLVPMATPTVGPTPTNYDWYFEYPQNTANYIKSFVWNPYHLSTNYIAEKTLNVDVEKLYGVYAPQTSFPVYLEWDVSGTETKPYTGEIIFTGWMKVTLNGVSIHTVTIPNCKFPQASLSGSQVFYTDDTVVHPNGWVSPNSKFDLYVGYYCGGGDDATISGTLTASMSPITPEATPTSTPYVTDCGDLGDSQGGGLTENDYFQLPTILQGTAQCTGLAEFTLDLDVLNLLPGMDLEDIYFPGLMVCAVPISFGELKIFGNTIDLDLLAYSMSAIAALFMFLGYRS